MQRGRALPPRAGPRRTLIKRVPPGVPLFAKQNANKSRLAFFYFQQTKHGACSSIGRAPDCGSGRCGFESHHAPHKKADRLSPVCFFIWGAVMGLERPTHSKNGGKLRAGEQFLGRGRVHRQQSAVLRTVNCCLSFLHTVAVMGFEPSRTPTTGRSSPN